MKDDSRINDLCLTSNGVRLTENYNLPRHVLGSVVRFSAACSFTAATRAGGTRPNIRVPSIRPGATQLTVIEGASATAKQRVRWIRPAFDTAKAMLPVGTNPGTPEMFTTRP